MVVLVISTTAAAAVVVVVAAAVAIVVVAPAAVLIIEHRVIKLCMNLCSFEFLFSSFSSTTVRWVWSALFSYLHKQTRARLILFWEIDSSRTKLSKAPKTKQAKYV